MGLRHPVSRTTFVDIFDSRGNRAMQIQGLSVRIQGPARCVSHKGKTFVVYHKGLSFVVYHKGLSFVVYHKGFSFVVYHKGLSFVGSATRWLICM